MGGRLGGGTPVACCSVCCAGRGRRAARHPLANLIAAPDKKGVACAYSTN